MPNEWIFSGSVINLVVTVPGRVNRDGNAKLAGIQFDHLPHPHKSALGGDRLAQLRVSAEAPLEDSERQPFTVFECAPSKRRCKPAEVDPLALRNEFLSLKEDSQKLLGFLNKYGAWQAYFRFGQWSTKGPGAEVQDCIVPPHYFWHYRALLRERLEMATRDSVTWFSSTMNPPVVQRISEYPFHKCEISFALDTIETSFSFDFLKRVPTSLCAREDCRKLFFVTRKDKIFCDKKCARVIVTRRGRLKKHDQSEE